MKVLVFFLLIVVTFTSCNMGKHYASMRIGSSQEVKFEEKSLKLNDELISNNELEKIKQEKNLVVDAPEIETQQENEVLPVKNIEINIVSIPVNKFEALNIRNKGEDFTPKHKRISEEFATDPLDAAGSVTMMLGATAVMGFLTMINANFAWIFFPMAFIAFPLGTLAVLILLIVAFYRLKHSNYWKKYRTQYFLIMLFYAISILITLLLLSFIFL